MDRGIKYNASGYLDLTAYIAISNVSKDEKRNADAIPNANRSVNLNANHSASTGAKTDPSKVFICSPFAGDVSTNVKKALMYCRFAVGKGKLPIAPHCYFPRFLDDNDPAERDLAISYGIRLLYECRELWVFGTRISDGMKKEILAAKWRGIRIRRFSENLDEII